MLQELKEKVEVIEVLAGNWTVLYFSVKSLVTESVAAASLPKSFVWPCERQRIQERSTF